jgi:hypothetical protein
VPSAGSVRRDHLVQVVAVDAQVVEVGKKRDVVDTAFCLGAVDHLDRVGRGAQGIRLRAADRLDEHGAADAGDGLGGQGEVLRPEVVLHRRVHAVQAVAVERVECAAAGGLGDAGDHVGVVAELL